MLVPQGSLFPGDELTVKWTGATAIAAGSYTSPPRPVSAGLEIAVPRSVLAYSLGQQVSVTYLIDRDGTTTESPPLLLNILPLPATALTAPKILEADTNNFLDVLALGTNDATIHALLHTLIEAGQPCWLRVEGKTDDGSALYLTLWNGLPAQVNSTWISQGFWPQTLANSYLRQLGHGSQLKIKLKVALNKSNVEADAEVFPERVYTVKAALEMTIDNSLMRLYAVKLLQNYGWGSKEVPGNVETRQPTGGTAPYTYQSDDPAVASVDSNGKVTGLKNGATTIRVSDQSGSTVSFAVDVRNVFRVIRGTATYSGNPQGDLEAQQWVYSQGGVALPLYLESFLANFINVYADVFEGTPITLPRGKCCVMSAIPPLAYYGSWMGMHPDGTFWFSSGSLLQLARAMAFVPT
ncbi:Ig-like domain-containing protein [Pseudomonas sp. R3-57]|uniref:Ig-like domain-containing protein n=1 Tax=unclassified Pseudomonas TaxID=196821 RepID=UPI003DA8C11E